MDTNQTVDQSTSSPSQGTDTGTTTTQTSTPEPLDFTGDKANGFIRVAGQKDPVKFSDYVRGFQSQWTKSAQEAARLKQQLAEREKEIQRYNQEREQASQQTSGDDVYAALEKLPYLNGKQAVEVVKAIHGQLQQRDMILMAALKQMQRMQQIVGGLHQNSTNSAFEAKISKWLTDGGYPPEAADLAKEIYLAYEGDDLDQEFPRIFKDRWEQTERIFEARRQAKINAARKQPFLPGKGGQTGPTKPLQLDPKASPKDIADLLWSNLQDEA